MSVRKNGVWKFQVGAMAEITKTSKLEFADHSLFLGMHDSNEKIRIHCKNYFVDKLEREESPTMSLEQVGKCDDVIWGYKRGEQDVYYPFMDNLHTILKILRVPYNQKDVETAFNDPRLKNLETTDKLTLGMVIAREGVLYTTRRSLVSLSGLPVLFPELGLERNFPDYLEKMYRTSLELKTCTQE